MASICNFCLKISNTCKSIDETLKETIELVFINVELVIAECYLICMECIQRLQLAFDLKAANICNEDLIVSYETNKPGHEKLIDFYLIKNKMEPDVFPYKLKICRFCITVVTESNYLLEGTDIDINIREIIRKHLPEIDLTITNNPLVCKLCLKKLQNYGMFINSWLEVDNLKKSYCSYNNKTDNPDLIEARKFIFETNKDPQHSDNYEIFSNNIKNENITKMFEIGEEGNSKSSHCFVDNIQLKYDIEIHESKLEYPAEGEQIKTETVCSDGQLVDDDLTMDYDFKMEESKLEREKLQSETKMESDDYFLNDHEIAVSDVMDAVDSTEVEENSERNSDTRSLCYYKGILEQKSNEHSSLSEHEVPIEISNDSKVSSSYFKKSFPKMEKNLHNLTNKSVCQLMPSRNNANHQLIKVSNGFKCGLCPFQNQLEVQVKVHFENSHSNEFTEHVGVELLKCLNCDYITNHKENLKNHLKKHSNEFLRYKCYHCDYKTKSKKFLKGHMIVHYEENEFYKCEQCDFKTNYKKSLKTHLMVHFVANVSHKCQHRDLKSKYKNRLKRHLKVHFSENVFHKCEHCDFKTKYKTSLKRHFTIHSNDVFHKCEHCDFKTKYKTSLKRHFTIYSNDNDFHKCEHCDFKTKYKNCLKSHLIVHSDENVFYRCEHCDFKTKYKTSLKTHLIMHSDENVFYTCEHCDYKTRHRGYLKNHSIIHYDENTFYQCEHCDFKTKYKFNLKNHLLVHSNNNVFYTCEHCDHKFKRKGDLKSHLIMHSNEKVFHKCEHCDFKTKYKTSLKRHFTIHSNDVFHKCEHCDFKTKYKTSLKRHFTIHSNDERFSQM